MAPVEFQRVRNWEVSRVVCGAALTATSAGTLTAFLAHSLHRKAALEGEDLSQRIARGAIPIDEALPTARQIAEALEAVHERSIIHRDVKPANIPVRSDGTVKVLDFGLAKAMDPPGASSSNPNVRAVDRRADNRAFGVVLYEMLSGARAFHGEDASVTLANVVIDDLVWSALPSSVRAFDPGHERACN